MGHHATMITLDPAQVTLGDRGAGLGRGLFIAGIVLLLAAFGVSFALYENGAEPFMRAYLVNFSFYTSLAIGALFFVLVHHLTRAGWGINVRRIAESMAMTMPVWFLLAIPILAGAALLYSWVGPVDDPHSLVAQKKSYLTFWFFVVRVVLYLGILTAIAWVTFRRSVQQDTDGNWRHSRYLAAFSAPGMMVFAITVTGLAIDVLMTLKPDWYSTIWGVYYFAGANVGFFATMILSTILLRKQGKLTDAIGTETYHDLGKLMFAFVVFWGYIAFSQYMLQWYANIPEETNFYQHRASDFNWESGLPVIQWNYLSIVLVAGHLFIPLLGLVSRSVKRNNLLLSFWALWMLAFHWIDLYWIVTPSVLYAKYGKAFQYETRADGGWAPYGSMDKGIPWGEAPIDVMLLVAMGLLFAGALLFVLGRQSLIPRRDPRIQESLQFHNPF